MTEKQGLQKRKCAPNPTAKHYFDNDKILALMRQYQIDRKIALDAGKEEPPLPVEVWLAVDSIAKNTGRRWNFAKYSYRDEMEGAALEAGIKGIKKFGQKPGTENYTNVFGYIGWIMWQRMVAVIKDEHKQSQIKKDMIINSGVLTELMSSAKGDDSDDLSDYYKYITDILGKEKETKEAE